MKPKTWRQSHDRFYSDCGERYRPLYAPHYDEDGVLNVSQVGETDLYASIQSHAVSVDIDNIIARFTNGDNSVLENRTPYYLDLEDIPDHPAKLMNALNKAEDYFNSLDADIREGFGNDFMRFICSQYSNSDNNSIDNTGSLPDRDQVGEDNNES